MLIPSWFLPGIILLVQSAQCGDVQDDRSLKESSKQIQARSESYRYNHPPLPEPEEKGVRNEKSLNINDRSPQNRTRSRVVRRQRLRKTSTASTLEIPVEVIYDTEPTTKQTTSSPLKSTTRKFVSRRRLPSDTSKKLDVRQTTNNANIDEHNVAASTTTTTTQVTTNTVKNDDSSSTEIPKRSRQSYFKKRTEPPAPRVKIVEEKNFVYAHSGNFHYSYLGGDGTKVSSKGTLKSYDDEKTGEAVSGNVSYKDKDGTVFNLSYTADENGYRPVGAHLPTPPPLPPAIARALKYIADKTTPSPQAKD
ncbi:uncharacterized protein [Epargyreus clarus]|uniref:uncharacterized protein n=1 Tax=Epargyreus clarus TaxID=520877 RepID=UPI003C2B5BEC